MGDHEMTSKYFTRKYWNEPPTSFEFGVFVGFIVGFGCASIGTVALVLVSGILK